MGLGRGRSGKELLSAWGQWDLDCHSETLWRERQGIRHLCLSPWDPPLKIVRDFYTVVAVGLIKDMGYLSDQFFSPNPVASWGTLSAFLKGPLFPLFILL